MNWSAVFAGLPPIELPNGGKLKTLADLRCYILKLPEREQPRWESVVAVLLQAAQHGGPFCFVARVAFSRTLHGVEGVGPRPERVERPARRAKRAGRRRASK